MEDGVETCVCRGGAEVEPCLRFGASLFLLMSLLLLSLLWLLWVFAVVKPPSELFRGGVRLSACCTASTVVMTNQDSINSPIGSGDWASQRGATGGRTPRRGCWGIFLRCISLRKFAPETRLKLTSLPDNHVKTRRMNGLHEMKQVSPKRVDYRVKNVSLENTSHAAKISAGGIVFACGEMCSA